MVGELSLGQWRNGNLWIGEMGWYRLAEREPLSLTATVLTGESHA